MIRRQRCRQEAYEKGNKISVTERGEAQEKIMFGEEGGRINDSRRGENARSDEIAQVMAKLWS